MLCSCERSDRLELECRLAGAALLSPVINYRWPGFPRELATEEYRKQQSGDQWSLRVSYYAPWLLYWWMNQSWLPTSTAAKGTTPIRNRFDTQKRNEGMADGTYEMVGDPLFFVAKLS